MLKKFFARLFIPPGWGLDEFVKIDERLTALEKNYQSMRMKVYRDKGKSDIEVEEPKISPEDMTLNQIIGGIVNGGRN